MDKSVMVSYFGRILLSLTLIVLCFFRSKLFHINSGLGLIAISVVAFSIGAGSILCIYKSICGIIMEFEKKSKITTRNALYGKTGTPYTVDALIALLERNDIIDIIVNDHGHLFHVGASSESFPGKTSLCNKRYYLGDADIEFDALAQRLKLLAGSDGKVSVMMIDDISP